MSELKCPFCGRKLERDDILGNSQPLYYCKNRNCERTKWLSGTPEFWQELIRTRKALNVAIGALKVYANQENWDFEHFYSLETYDIAGDALEQITALEQKD